MEKARRKTKGEEITGIRFKKMVATDMTPATAALRKDDEQLGGHRQLVIQACPLR